MSLPGIGTGVGPSPYLTGGTQLQQQTSGVRRPGSVSSLANDTVSLSKQGLFLSGLQALKASDPLKFKEVVSQTASDLQAAAVQAGNTTRGQSLSTFAQKFQEVADGGDISQLKPATPSNRVQQAYGAYQPDGVQDLLNSLSANHSTGSTGNVQQGSVPAAIADGGSSFSFYGIDPQSVLKSVFGTLSKTSGA